MTIIWGIILVYVVLVLDDTSKPFIEDIKESADDTCVSNIKVINVECKSVIVALQHRSFWILLYFITVSSWSEFFFAFMYKEIGFLYQYSDYCLTIIGVMYSVSNGLGRLFWGYMFQRLNFKKLYGIILFGQVSSFC
jgi:hypothetical protein